MVLPLHHKPFRKGGRRYVVNPLALIYTNDKYYLVCYSDKYRTLANYRIDRMEKVEVERGGITPVAEFENFSVHAHKRQAFSMFTGELKEVLLTVDNSCIDAILDKFGEQVPLTRVDEGHFSVRVKVQVSPTLFAWCLTSCGKIRISEPAEVVKGFEEYVKTCI
ncbi:MAG: WYL domain-containing protein [Firmicutes bacterium]|nr:WYL domain-containing protein [Bacillota bacterium]